MQDHQSRALIYARRSPRHRLTLPIPDPLCCRSEQRYRRRKPLIRSDEDRLAAGGDALARSQRVCVSKRSGCQRSRLEEFPPQIPEVREPGP